MKKFAYVLLTICILCMAIMSGCNDVNDNTPESSTPAITDEPTFTPGTSAKRSPAKDPDDHKTDKIMFIGDSITEGLKIYNTIPGAIVQAYLGLSSYKLEEELQYVLEEKPDRLFVMVGLNDIYGQEENPQFFENYKNFINAVKDELPDTNIYVQSILPISRQVETENANLTKELIDSFNRRLKIMAEENDVEYLDIAAEFKDQEGYMNDEYSPDGIHLWSQYYKVWADSLVPYMGNFKYPPVETEPLTDNDEQVDI